MRERLEQWNYYREWAEAHSARDERTFEAILRDLDFLYRQFSRDTRAIDPDPEKLGIQAMRSAFERYDRRTRRPGLPTQWLSPESRGSFRWRRQAEFASTSFLPPVQRQLGARAIPVASLEDLILLKVVSPRENVQTDLRPK